MTFFFVIQNYKFLWSVHIPSLHNILASLRDLYIFHVRLLGMFLLVYYPFNSIVFFLNILKRFSRNTFWSQA